MHSPFSAPLSEETMINDSRQTLIDCHSRLREFCQSQLSILINAASEYLFQQAEQANDNETQQRYFEVQKVIDTEQKKLSKHFNFGSNFNFERKNPNLFVTFPDSCDIQKL